MIESIRVDMLGGDCRFGPMVFLFWIALLK